MEDPALSFLVAEELEDVEQDRVADVVQEVANHRKWCDVLAKVLCQYLHDARHTQVLEGAQDLWLVVRRCHRFNLLRFVLRFGFEARAFQGLHFLSIWTLATDKVLVQLLNLLSLVLGHVSVDDVHVLRRPDVEACVLWMDHRSFSFLLRLLGWSLHALEETLSTGVGVDAIAAQLATSKRDPFLKDGQAIVVAVSFIFGPDQVVQPTSLQRIDQEAKGCRSTSNDQSVNRNRFASWNTSY